MTATPKAPAKAEIGAVELTETELDQASGGYSNLERNEAVVKTQAVGIRKSGESQPGIASDPETGGERA